MSKPDKKAKEKFAGRLNSRWGIPPGQARQLAKVDDAEAEAADITAALIQMARTFPKAQHRRDMRVSRSKGVARFPRAARQLVRSAAPALKPVAVASSIVFAALLTQERVFMEFIDALFALFPVVGATALLIRYIVEAVKKFAPESVFAQYPGRVAAALNVVAWVGLGVAAIYGADGEALEVIRRLTDAWPGIVGLVELAWPVFLSILATKGVHELLKRTEGKSRQSDPFRGLAEG